MSDIQPDRTPDRDNPADMSSRLRIGTRGSRLALVQTHNAWADIARHHGLDIALGDIQVFRTSGDRIQDRALAEVGGKALWTRELDRALLAGEVDMAVHSMKDVETWMADGIALGAVLPRADPRDRLIGAVSLAGIEAGALVGSSSPRRVAQLRSRRPDLRVSLLRGNVETRLKRVADGDFAATFLAAAGLERLGLTDGTALETDDWLPAASQGVVGITCRADDRQTLALLAAVDDAQTRRCLDAERAVLAGLGGSCRTAVAAHCHSAPDGDGLILRAELLMPDGSEAVTASASGTDPQAMGAAVAAELLAQASPALRATLEP